MKKICIECKKEFETKFRFPQQKYCSIKCKNKFNKRKYLNSEKGKKTTKEYSKKYYNKNPELLRKKRKEYYYKNQEEEKRKRRKYYYNNLDKENSEENKRRRREYKKNIYSKKPENKKKMWEYQKKKLKEDKDYYVRSLLRSRLNHAINYYRRYGVVIKSKSGLLDYQKIVEHLKPFPKDISKYDIDHIKPLVRFNLVHKDGSLNIVEIKKAFTPKNHQWLLSKDNQIKWKN